MNLQKSARALLLLTLLTFTFLLRIEHRVTFYDVGNDKTHQIIASGNLVHGRGISECTVTPDDLATVTCTPQSWWAPGYPLLLGSLYLVTKDFILADYVLILLGLALLLGGLYKIFEIWEGETNGRGPFYFFLIFSAFSFAPYHYLTTTDLLATGFFAMGCAQAIAGMRNRLPLHFIAAGACVFFAALMKYNFYPFLFVVPGGLCLLALIRRDKRLEPLAYFLAPVLIGFLLMAATIPQHLLNQDAGNFTKGWNWSSLSQFDAFASKTIFFTEPILGRFSSGSLSAASTSLILTGLSIGLVVLCIVSGIMIIKRVGADRKDDDKVLFALLAIVTLILNIAFLSWLSIRLPEFPQPNNPHWTFVWETRYYAPSMIFILAFVFLLPFRMNSISRRSAYASFLFVFIVMGSAGAYWFWKHYDIFYNGRMAGTYTFESKDNISIAKFLTNDSTLSEETAVLGFLSIASASGPAQLINRGQQLSGRSEDDFDLAQIGGLRSTEPRVLILRFDKQLSDDVKQFLIERRGTRIMELSDSDLYRIEISP